MSKLLRKYLLAGLFSLLWLTPLLAADPGFYSDTFTFVGQDETGYTLFSLENNRGRENNNIRAEHRGVLFDQFRGWINLVGTGAYENPTAELETIPDSPMFRFASSKVGGLTIRSRANDLVLKLNPLAIRMSDAHDGEQREWGSAAALLSWQGRNIPGRVIYKRRVQQGWPSTGDSASSWEGFQGFSLAVKSGAASSWQDIYLQSEELKKRQRTRGFIDAGRRQANLIAPDLKVTEKSWAWGLYRWNRAWTMSLQQVQADGMTFPPFAHLQLNQVSRVNRSNWVLGGVALSVVEGTIEINSQQIPVLGLVEQVR